MSESIIYHPIQISGSENNPDFTSKEYIRAWVTSGSGSGTTTGTLSYTGDVYIINVMLYMDNGWYLTQHTPADFIPQKITFGETIDVFALCGLSSGTYLSGVNLTIATDYSWSMVISGSSGKKKGASILLGYI